MADKVRAAGLATAAREVDEAVKGKSAQHSQSSKTVKSWRDVLPVHPAADLFPMMTPEERLALGNDIKKNGLQVPVATWRSTDDGKLYLLDGRNRLDAIELVGSVTSIQ